jgi:NAD(P)-dependent dehydrogenase (short-subunit alcohol dehydrogenase family)
MTAELEGRVAIITGGSRGIGLATAALLAERGASVVLTSRSQAAADQAAGTIPGGRAIGVAADLLDEDAARACVDLTLERFGSLDILVNNAGIGANIVRLVDHDYASFREIMDTNLWAPIFWSGLAWHAWMRDHGGAIVNVSSLGGLSTAPNIGTYAASKAALLHITRHQAVELAPNVRVNAVAPGVVKTKLSEGLWRNHGDKVVAGTPLGRLGEPEDVAGLIAFLVSDAASWITGETVLQDGGAYLVGTF